MLMSPKGWLGFWIWWVWWSNEYWSKKSIEYTLKRVALVCAILTVLCFLFIPYTKVASTTKSVWTWSSLLNNLQQSNIATWTILSWVASTWAVVTWKIVSWVVISWN